MAKILFELARQLIWKKKWIWMEGKNQFGREGIFVDNNTFFNTSISAVCLLRQFAAASLHVVFFSGFQFLLAKKLYCCRLDTHSLSFWLLSAVLFTLLFTKVINKVLFLFCFFLGKVWRNEFDEYNEALSWRRDPPVRPRGLSPDNEHFGVPAGAYRH